MADVLQAAINDGLHIDSVLFPNGTYRDIGTPETLLKAVRSEIAQKGDVSEEATGQ